MRKERLYWGSALNCCLDCWERHSALARRRDRTGIFFGPSIDEFFEMAKLCKTCSGTGRQQIPLAEVIKRLE